MNLQYWVTKLGGGGVGCWGGLGVGETEREMGGGVQVWGRQRKEPSVLGRQRETNLQCQVAKWGGGAFKCGGDRDREKRIFGCGGHTEREKNFQCWVVKRGSRVSGVGERENNLLTLIIRVGRQRKLRFKLTTYM